MALTPDPPDSTIGSPSTAEKRCSDSDSIKSEDATNPNTPVTTNEDIKKFIEALSTPPTFAGDRTTSKLKKSIKKTPRLEASYLVHSSVKYDKMIERERIKAEKRNAKKFSFRRKNVIKHDV